LSSSWYFYQKTKNYRVLFGGIKAGLKTGARLGAWTGAFVGLEEGVEWTARKCVAPQYEDWKTRWASGLLSGVAVAGAGGWWCECFLFPLRRVASALGRGGLLGVGMAP